MSKVAKGCLIAFAALIIGGMLTLSGFVFGQFASHYGYSLPGLTTQDTPGTPESALNLPATDREQLAAPFWEAWELVQKNYVDQPVDQEKMMQGAIRGMIESLGDPFSSYMSPTEYALANSDLAGQLEGIGAEVDPSGDYVKIISPLPGSPAEAAGVLPGDVILKVDGEDMTGLDGFAVILKVRGPAGSTVHLTIQRADKPDLLEFTIVRAKITIPSVTSKTVGAANDVAYIRLNNFGENTGGELKDALRELLKKNPKGIILDLRGNPGGYLSAAVDVGSQFIGSGRSLLIEQFGDGREQIYEAERGGLATDIPLVVLINAGSASASEIIAGAIQDNQRGTLVGETSFGKGSVQTWSPLQDERGAVRVTIARWLTPDHRQISKVGISPDVEVKLTDEDRTAGRDPQLDRAVEILLRGK